MVNPIAMPDVRPDQVVALVDREGIAVGIPTGVERLPTWGGAAAAPFVLGAFEVLRSVAWAPAVTGDAPRVTVETDGGLLVIEPISKDVTLVVSVDEGLPGALRRAIAAVVPRLRETLQRCAAAAPSAHGRLDRGMAELDALYGLLEELHLRLGADAAWVEVEAWRRELLQSLFRLTTDTARQADLMLLETLCSAEGLALPERFLGAGWWGGVYQLSDQSVVKLTRDRREAEVSAALVGRQGTHLADFYAVKQLSLAGERVPYYFLHRELVAIPEPEPERVRCQQLVKLLVLQLDPKEFTDLAAYTPDDIDRAQRTAAGLATELCQAGIMVRDLHASNLGVKDGELCLFDLSLGDGPAIEVAELRVQKKPSPMREVRS